MPSVRLASARALLLALTVVGFAGAGPACSSSSDQGPPAPTTSEPPRARFTVPPALSALDDDHFYDHPWPSDFRREKDKSIRLDGWPNPRKATLVGKYLDQLRGKIPGFSPGTGGYLGFTKELDPATLPADAKASLSPTSTLQLIDLEKGTRHPVVWKLRGGGLNGPDYYQPWVISWQPSLGRPLRGNARYAIVVTRAVTGVADASGKKLAVEPSTELADLLAGKGPLAADWGPAITALEKAGVAAKDVAQLGVFTTWDPTAELAVVAEHARSLEAPKVTRLVKDTEDPPTFERYEGDYDGSPDYQEGTVPFLTTGGGFVFGADGKPVLQRTFKLRFKLAVPGEAKCPMPAGGYPIVLYAHGTGGDYASFLRDGTAVSLADQCIASMGIDQIFHGTRPGAPPLDDPARDSKISFLFFNVDNALASRTNTRQSAVDEIARARLITSGGLVVPSTVAKRGKEITFDKTRIGFFGHSQGGLNGPLFFAVDDQARGGVLSGAGSAIAFSLIKKSKPDPSVSGLIKVILKPEYDSEFDEMNPIMTLIQTIIDPADPLHYYPHIATAPMAGRKPKSFVMTEGVGPDGEGDSYAPPRTIEAGAIAAGAPLLKPVVWDVPEITALAGTAPVALPVNANAAGGKATFGLAQFTPNKKDGHYVVFDVPAARALTTSFCVSLLRDDVPTVGP